MDAKLRSMALIAQRSNLQDLADRQKSSGLQTAVELRLGGKRARQLQDFVGAAQLLYLALRRGDAITLAALSACPCLSHPNSAWLVQPIIGAMDSIAAHSDGCSPRCSRCRCTARSRTSGKTWFVCSWAPFSQELEPPLNAGRFSHLCKWNLPHMSPAMRQCIVGG